MTGSFLLYCLSVLVTFSVFLVYIKFYRLKCINLLLDNKIKRSKYLQKKIDSIYHKILNSKA